MPLLGDTPHLVVGRQSAGDRGGDLAGRTGDQDFGAAHEPMVGDPLHHSSRAKSLRNRRMPSTFSPSVASGPV